MAEVGGLPGGAIGPDGRGAGGIRPSDGGGAQISRPGGERPGIADGSIVDGLVTGRDGDMYQVKIGQRTLNARSTIPLFVGQRFRAVWDASSSPPTLRLSHSDMTMLARFSGRDQSVASALLSRGMPVSEANVAELRRLWMKGGGTAERLGALAELLARGLETSDRNISLIAWYMGLSSEDAARIWRRIRARAREGKFASPRELLSALRDDEDEETSTFLEAHTLAGRPARGGLDPASLLVPARWPLDVAAGPLLAKVAFAREVHDGRGVWRAAFEFEGRSLGVTRGGLITDERAMSVSIRVDGEAGADRVRDAIPDLRRELASVPLILQYLGVSASSGDDEAPEGRYGLDMEI